MSRGEYYIRDELIELQKVLNQKCYWWVLVNTAYLCVHLKGEQMDIKLPIPVILGNPKWNDEKKWKKQNDAEVVRCKAIWGGLTSSIEEKIKRIEAGKSTMEKEFTGGILFEDGKYGLKYKESWSVR